LRICAWRLALLAAVALVVAAGATAAPLRQSHDLDVSFRSVYRGGHHTAVWEAHAVGWLHMAPGQLASPEP